MNKFEYKNLTPFKWFVLENFPFIEADFDALTEWQLFCKLGKEMNKIINSENTLGTQMENVTNAFIELQNYVNYYFDNLDVQDEINNKLNQMSSDGTLENIINNEIFGNINNEIVNLKKEDEKLSETISNVSGSVNRLNNDVIMQNQNINVQNQTINSQNLNIQNLKNNLDTQTQRIDNLSNLEAGSTTGDAELQDIRIGFNGVTYPTAGDSVRSQAKLLNNKIVNINNEIGTINTKQVELEKETDLIGSLEGNIGEVISFGNQDYYVRKSYPVIQGQLYNITSFKPSFPFIWFVDKDNKIIEKYDTHPSESGVIVTENNVKVPENATTMWVQCYGSHGFWEAYVKVKLVTTIPIQEQINEIGRRFIINKEGTGDFTTLKEGITEACKYFNSIVYIDEGVYDLIEEFGQDYLDNNTDDSGIIIKNNVHLIFSSGAKVKCNYTGQNAYTKENFSVFNSLTTWKAGGYKYDGCIIENANIEASNIRYIIHDEHGGSNVPYRNIYKNCIMKLDNSMRTDFQQCIGGGLGQHGEIIIKDCYFNSLPFITQSENESVLAVSYHNNSYQEGTLNDLSNIIVSGNVFAGIRNTFQAQCYGQSTLKTKCLVNNNLMNATPILKTNTNINMEIIEWNNKINI